MSAHSPGPWRLHRDWDTWPFVLDANGDDVAEVCGDRSERERAGRLIAAAPELLEALKSAVDALDRFKVSGGGVDEWRALIAMVEGGK